MEKARTRTLLWILPLTAILSLAVTIGGYWLYYVTAAPEPYDEVGIDINKAMPKSLKAFGCAKLHARFAAQLPPYGCADATGMGWRR